MHSSNDTVFEVYRNFDGRYVIKRQPCVGYQQWLGHYNCWFYNERYSRKFWFKWSAILKAKQLEREHDKSLRRLKFKPVKVWR